MHNHEVNFSKLPVCEIDCEECGSFRWSPPKNYFDTLLLSHREMITGLIEVTSRNSMVIIKSVLEGLYFEIKGKIAKEVMYKVYDYLYVSVSSGFREAESVVPSIPGRWIETNEGELYVNIHCDFCGDITWHPPKSITEIMLKEDLEKTLIGVALILHLLTDGATCLLKFNGMKYVFEPGFNKATELITYLDSVQIIFVAMGEAECKHTNAFKAVEPCPN